VARRKREGGTVMAMFFLFLGFIALWAITEIIETFLNEKRRHESRHCQKRTLRWID